MTTNEYVNPRIPPGSTYRKWISRLDKLDMFVAMNKDYDTPETMKETLDRAWSEDVFDMFKKLVTDHVSLLSEYEFQQFPVDEFTDTMYVYGITPEVHDDDTVKIGFNIVRFSADLGKYMDVLREKGEGYAELDIYSSAGALIGETCASQDERMSDGYKIVPVGIAYVRVVPEDEHLEVVATHMASYSSYIALHDISVWDSDDDEWVFDYQEVNKVWTHMNTPGAPIGTGSGDDFRSAATLMFAGCDAKTASSYIESVGSPGSSLGGMLEQLKRAISDMSKDMGADGFEFSKDDDDDGDDDLSFGFTFD